MALLPLPISMSSSGPASSRLSPPPSLGSHGLPLARRRADRCPVSERRTGAPSIVCLRGGYSDLMTEKDVNATFGRHSFPRGFTFGAASSAFQIEGAWNEEGKGPSIWDTFTHKFPDHIADKSTADVAVDSYHRYKEDVKLLKDMNMDAYRFSISWPRILPNGSLKGGVNQEGINYYNNLINELIANGITPFVTLFHWDVPQALEDEYDGFRSKKIVDDFKDFCDVCFGEFGDRVKNWITLNEPWSFATMGYGLGSMAPGRCSPLPYFNCPVPSGNSVEEPYVVTHNEILAHGAAAKLYREKYQTKQGGQIGITLVSLWFEPWDPEHPNFEASIRALDFMLAWYIDPLQHGDYPFAMKSLVRERLPVFTSEESEMLKKASYDFIGINYYSARYASPLPFVHDQPPFISVNDSYAQQDPEKNGQLIGEWNGSWLYVYPPGIHRLLMYLKRRFNNPPVYITENGYSQVDHDMSKEEAIADDVRKDYIESHLREVSSAIRQGANVKGYFAWSLTDNFEWEKGYTERFGLNYVDYETLKRYPKNSAKWFAEFLKPKRVPRPRKVPQTSMKWEN